MGSEYEIKTPEIEDPDEEDYDEDEDDDDDDDPSPLPGILGKILFFVLAFSLGAGTSTVYHQFQSPPEVAVEEPIVEEVIPELPPPPDPTIYDLLADGVMFGDTVTDMVLDDPDLFALSHQGNHYGLFIAGLVLPWNQDVALRNIFYFYDEEKQMNAVQYLLKPQEEVLSPEDIQLIVAELNQMFPLLYESQEYFVWQCEGGFVGFHSTQMFLYLCQTEAEIRGVFP